MSRREAGTLTRWDWNLCDARGMRHALIAFAIAGCGGHSGATSSDAAPAQAVTRDDLARACMNASACFWKPLDTTTAISTCLNRLDDVDTLVSIYRPAQIQCLVAAGADCAAARACLGYTFGACSPDGERCDGDRLVSCSAGFETALNCRGSLWFTSDSTCVMGASPGCGLATCAAGTPDRCDGSRAVACRDGVLEVIDCAQVGETCSTSSGTLECAGTGAACTASRCEGNQLIRCDTGHEQRYACDAMFDGGTCVGYGRGGAQCGFGPDCGGAATCDGNVAQLCVLGAQTSIDCVAAGFARCSQGSCIPATFP